MAIVYYPNRIYKSKVPAIDKVIEGTQSKAVKGGADTTSEALDAIISSTTDWEVKTVTLKFSAATSRDFSIGILEGRNVVENLNDYLWFQTDTSLPQQITLDAGFYTGTELAAELQTQLDANSAFVDLGITFTVVYDSAAGEFTITPSSGTLRYLNVNTMQTLRTRDSIAGHLFGLTEDSAFGATVVTDDPVFGLDSEALVVDETGSTVLSAVEDTDRLLDVDQAIRIQSSVAAITVDYSVTYEEQ